MTDTDINFEFGDFREKSLPAKEQVLSLIMDRIESETYDKNMFCNDKAHKPYLAFLFVQSNIYITVQYLDPSKDSIPADSFFIGTYMDEDLNFIGLIDEDDELELSANHVARNSAAWAERIYLAFEEYWRKL